MKRQPNPSRKGKTMRTRICWILCLAVSVIFTTASPSRAQEDPASAGGADASRQRERTNADLQSAQSATRTQAPRGTGSIAVDPAGLPPFYGVAPLPSNFGVANQQLQTQRLPTAYPQPGIFSTGLYPGFDPELARVNNAANQAIMDLRNKIKEAESEEVKLELKAEMKQVLDEQYDEYLSHHEAPLKELEARLEKLRAEFESRKKAKDDLVNLRLDTIWYDAIGLGWPDERRFGTGFAPTWSQPNQPAIPTAIPNSGQLPRTPDPRLSSPSIPAGGLGAGSAQPSPKR